MTRKIQTITVYTTQAWSLTAHYMKIIRMAKAGGHLTDDEYNALAMRLSLLHREAEKKIMETKTFTAHTRFNKFDYEEEIKKIIRGAKSEYNNNNIWLFSTSLPAKKNLQK